MGSQYMGQVQQKSAHFLHFPTQLLNQLGRLFDKGRRLSGTIVSTSPGLGESKDEWINLQVKEKLQTCSLNVPSQSKMPYVYLTN